MARSSAGIALGGAAGAVVQQGIGLTAGLSFLRMSRDAEKQADLMGTDILYDAGYDPRALPQFFEVIQGKYGEGGSQFLSDHPNPGNRVGYVNDEIDSLPPRTKYIKTSPEFARIKKIAAGMHPYTAKQVASGAWKGRAGMRPRRRLERSPHPAHCRGLPRSSGRPRATGKRSRGMASPFSIRGTGRARAPGRPR